MLLVFPPALMVVVLLLERVERAATDRTRAAASAGGRRPGPEVGDGVDPHDRRAATDPATAGYRHPDTELLEAVVDLEPRAWARLVVDGVPHVVRAGQLLHRGSPRRRGTTRRREPAARDG
ncbi:hypothetical protein [Actinomycetospora sp. TBRC 11914]|uniref:hypothetical protein n=1 Tax=Actinomycetospora sp. TBRC 11914 TaxID=2729387 RepID=UPI00145D6B43|nr:hypothetical protein [Actinomycetospora sp. TBRC 11914]NMO88388.1 hypothetical protein [Actinomycetospora sp. TBRC 11914]